MKKLILIPLLFLFILPAQQADAQDYLERMPKRNVLKICPIDFFTSSFVLGYERKIKNNDALVLFLSLRYMESNSFYGDEFDRALGYRSEFQYRINIFSQGEERPKDLFYLAPYVLYRFEDRNNAYTYGDDGFGNWASTNMDITYNIFGGGVLFGFNFIAGKRLNFDAYLGGGFRYSNDNDPYNYNSGITQVGYSGIAPRIGFNVGLNF